MLPPAESKINTFLQCVFPWPDSNFTSNKSSKWQVATHAFKIPAKGKLLQQQPDKQNQTPKILSSLRACYGHTPGSFQFSSQTISSTGYSSVIPCVWTETVLLSGFQALYWKYSVTSGLLGKNQPNKPKLTCHCIAIVACWDWGGAQDKE